jgi:hypothetical protein
MTRNLALLAYDLAVAVVSIALLIATPVWLATHQIDGLPAIFLLIGSALGCAVAALRFQFDKEPWLISLFAPVETPATKIVQPSFADWFRFFDWTRPAQRA